MRRPSGSVQPPPEAPPVTSHSAARLSGPSEKQYVYYYLFWFSPMYCFSDGPLSLAAECDVTGGASGGGWTLPDGRLNSVTAYDYATDPTTAYGPYFGKEVARLFHRAGRVR